MKLNRFRLFSLASLVALIILCIIWIQFSAQHKPQRVKNPPTVSVIKVVTNQYEPTISAIGTLQASQGTILKAQTDGQVQSITFTPGTDVQTGDVLVTLNNTQQKGALDAAIAQEKYNKIMYQRDLELKKLGAISLAAVDQAKEAVDAGEATIQQAQGAYDLTVITAPFPGRLGINKINIGDYVQLGTEIVSLQNLNPMFLDFYVPEKKFPDITLGEVVKVNANTLPDQTFVGKVTNYETVIDQNTGMLQVRAEVPNEKAALLPGGYATVIVETGKPREVISIPQTALLYDADGAYVYLVQNGKAQRQVVKLGDQIQQTIEITQGLKAGDVIVSAGTNKVSNGDAVNAVMETGVV